MVMQLYSISEVSQWIECKSVINKETLFSYLVTDSRTILDPERSFFIAIAGENHNGHDYIPMLYRQGVRCFMVNSAYVVPEEFTDANFIFVENTLNGFQQLAAHKRKLYNCPVIGITGSNGKTIIKEWIAQLIGKNKTVVRSPKSYNSQIGVPLSVWQLESATDVGIFEAGLSQKGEMEKIARVILPTIGVITNIGAAHQENFASKKEKLLEKLKLFDTCDTIVFSCDSALITKELQEFYPDKKWLSWGKNQEATLKVITKNTLDDYTEIELFWKDKLYSVIIPFTDEVSYENAMHAIATLLALDFSLDFIADRLSKLVPVAMRMELKEGVNNCILINDSYNSDISSLALSLDFLVQQSSRKITERTLILSDIYQSGLENYQLCIQVNDLLKQKGITKLIGVGAILKAHAHVFEMNAVFYDTTHELLNAISQNSFNNEAILIKGSRNFAFEKVAEFLEQKHHQTRLEINLNALIHNLNHFRAKLNPTTKVLAMVKAFSYGSGSFEIANVLQHHKVDYLGVAFADEGVELRKCGISLPIIVMNPEVKSFPIMLANQLEPEIYSFKVLQQFAKELKAEGIAEYPVHIKYDTGMNRLGFVADEVDKLIAKLKNKPELRVKSVFSHLAGSDDPALDDFTNDQINRFTTFAFQIENELGYSCIKHLLNSAGILRFPEAQFDMVRLGIGMYGIGAIEQESLKSVTRFKSYISQIKHVKAHDTIGYNRKGELPYDAEIAVVPVGYADGLFRRLSNGVGKMMVKGKLASIVGNICMDMCMIDVTGLNTSEGDEVEVFGEQHPVTKLANALETIPYEIFTSISRRVKRVYYYE
jgi:alanine racemase